MTAQIIQSAKDVVFHRIMDLGTGPIPTDAYRSASFHDLEKERIFKRAWLSVAHIVEVPNPGDYLVLDIAAGDCSIIIVHGRDRVVRAFYDVCPHRGSKISPAGATCGRVRSLKCRYHAWNFDLDGKLLFVPGRDQFFDLPEDIGLLPIHCETWEGQIFINLQRGEPDISLSEYLGDFGRFYTGLQGLPGHPLNADTDQVRVQAVWKCNWKLAMGAFVEAYHIRTLHPKTIGNHYASAQNPFGHPEAIARWGPHTCISLYGNPSYQLDAEAMPVEAAFNPRGYHNPKSVAELDSAGLGHPAINFIRTENWAQDIYHLFPNTFLYVRTGGSSIVRWWPLSHDRMIWDAQLFFPRAQTMRQRMAQEFAVGRQREIVMEDMINLAAQQDALAKSPLEHMQYGDGEVMLRMIDEIVRQAVDAKSIRDIC